MTRKFLKITLIVFLLGLFLVLPSTTPANISFSSANRGVIPRNAPAASTQGTFAFVSNFESQTLEGWQGVAGATPSVVVRPSYSGEPSLASSARKGTQIDTASQGFVTGDSFISFQVAIDASKASGFFGLDGTNGPVALVGVSNGKIVAGPDMNSLQSIEAVPTGTAYPTGWSYISANIYDASTSSNPSAGWVMQLFVDKTDQIAATVNVPNAASYTGAIIETTQGTAYYTDIVVSTYEIPIYIPGYNNMEGYGQGSGLLVNLLPAYYKLTAEMTLNSWNTPQQGILSYQINAMNFYGTTTSTCVGFFQLGVDLNPNGYISPWYVPGKNCFAHYFLSSQNPAVEPGVFSPPGTHLVLSIVYDLNANYINFTILDTSINEQFSATIPYSGTPFYGMYTQLEFQPCCNTSSIQSYKVSGALYNMQVTTLSGNTQSLPASYMLPFTLDAPPSWDFTYYQNSSAGYQQISQ